jgi:hypothetical protein
MEQTATEIPFVEDDVLEERLVREWRTEQLLRLGLPHAIAETFADVVDWHQLADLVEHGCPPDLALEIVR